jgi:hypothetical protein
MRASNNPRVVKLVKSFGATWEITERLDDFRYEPNKFFSVEDVLLLFLRFNSLHHVGFHGVHHGNGIVEINAVDQRQYVQK